MYGTGISREGEIIDIGSAQGIIDKAGSWYSYDGERIGRVRTIRACICSNIRRLPRRSRKRSVSR